MLKRKFLRRLGIIISCLIVVEIIYLYPSDCSSYNVSEFYNDGIIYLIDDNSYVSRLEMIYSSTNMYDLIREMVSLLTLNSDDSLRIRSGFTGVIPEGTKLLSIRIEDDVAYLNFSKELLTISKDNEVKLIEALIYTITSIEKINYISLLVEGNTLSSLPNSKKELPKLLDRSFKINKEYNITSLTDVKETVVYYMASLDDYDYYIPVTKYYNDDKEKIEIIINELKSSSTYNTNLISYLNEETKLISYEVLDNSLILNFSNNFFSDLVSANVVEEVKFAINQSVSDSYNLDSVLYYSNSSVIG